MRHGKSSGRTTCFTLVELLVTIVVIVILASLLLPALNAARGKAQGAGCISNLRQIGYGANMYANDWDGYLPDVYRNSDRTQAFCRILRPYLGEPCDPAYFASRSLRTILRCPGQKIPSGVTRLLSGYTTTHQWFTTKGTYGCWSYDVGSVRYQNRIGTLKEKGILVTAAPLAQFEMSGGWQNVASATGCLLPSSFLNAFHPLESERRKAPLYNHAAAGNFLMAGLHVQTLRYGSQVDNQWCLK